MYIVIPSKPSAWTKKRRSDFVSVPFSLVFVVHYVLPCWQTRNEGQNSDGSAENKGDLQTVSVGFDSLSFLIRRQCEDC